MLKSLRKLDRKTSERILSDLTTALLPNPGIEGVLPQSVYDPSVYESIKEEVYQLLKIDPTDLSSANQAKVFQFLAREMRSIALADADLNSIKWRVGQRGDLRPDLYEIEFSAGFANYEALGVRRNHAIDTIRDFDDVEEVLPDRFQGGYVLFIKTHNKMNERDRFSLLVCARRKGDSLVVMTAWRIYHSDVDVSKARSLIDFLESFAESFGFRITLGNKQGKFILHETVEVATTTRVDQIVHIHEAHPASSDTEESIIINYVIRKSDIKRLFEFGIVFALDAKKYLTSIRSHGVEASGRFMSSPPYALNNL